VGILVISVPVSQGRYDYPQDTPGDRV